jgi:pseudouridine-5'-phosphate glycosidase
MQSVPLVSERVRAALADGRPVVALESTIISHGFPRPRNRELAFEFEAALVDRDVTPATVAVVDGTPKVGLTEEDLTRLADDADVAKASTRDLPVVMGLGRTAATTVAATSFLAAAAGVRVFATGGLGGVHRDAPATMDESADIAALAQTRITVVSAGVKSILDIPLTLERLETSGVSVVGYRTDRFPSFWLSDSGQSVDWVVDSADQVADLMLDSDRLDRRGGILVANPLPTDEQLDPDLHDRVVAEGLRDAADRGVRGKALTPHLLDYIHRATGGASLEVNVTIAKNNIALAAEIATAWSRKTHPTEAP